VSVRVRAILGTAAFLLAAPGTVAGLVPYLLTRWRLAPPFFGVGALRYVGEVFVALGLVSLLDSFARFALVGRGTPAPIAPTEELVVSGQHRYVRNPMYLAVLSIVAGQALLFGSTAALAYVATLFVTFDAFVVGYEEPTLARRYGASYERYRATVNRWLPAIAHHAPL
jgi:protein-S-isoprenylcysteine O-methyltransferase Ste14